MTTKAWSLAAALALACAPCARAADPIGYVAGDGVNTVPVTAATPLPVTLANGAAGAASTDASGTVVTGGTYQTVFVANAGRRGCLIQNPVTASEALNVKAGVMASPFTVPIGGSFSCASPGGLVVTDAISVTAATTAHAFAAVSQ
jgi:hypothetical protein